MFYFADFLFVNKQELISYVNLCDKKCENEIWIDSITLVSCSNKLRNGYCQLTGNSDFTLKSLLPVDW